MASAVSTDTDSHHESVMVCSLQQLQSVGKMTVNVHGREILLVHHRGSVHALDKKCYHSGGPLNNGEVKDIEDYPCVICPWHKYILRLDTGEGLYQSIDPARPQVKPEWASKGVKQRTHKVVLRDDCVYVTLSDLKQTLESDYYYSEEYKQKMKSTLASVTNS